MEYIGIDVHKRDSQVCILGEGGEVVLEQRVRTQQERLGELLSKRPKARILLEASTESEWVPGRAARATVHGAARGPGDGMRLRLRGG